jgi:hypothetical protein
MARGFIFSRGLNGEMKIAGDSRMTDTSGPIDASQAKAAVPWINITMNGAKVGLIVGSMTFIAASHASRLVATGSGVGVDALSMLAGYGAGYFWGPGAAFTVRTFGKVAAESTENNMKYAGVIAAGGLGAAAGALTALSITVGTKVVEYSVEYGGKISAETARVVAEKYLEFRSRQTGTIEGVEAADIDSEGGEYVYVMMPTEPEACSNLSDDEGRGGGLNIELEDRHKDENRTD